jgi:hypothetical protein
MQMDNSKTAIESSNSDVVSKGDLLTESSTSEVEKKPTNEAASTPEDSESVDSAAITATAFAMGAFALTYSNKSSASICGDIIGIALKVIGTVYTAIEVLSQFIGWSLTKITDEIIESVMDTLKDMFNSIFETTSTSVGKTGDSINTTAQTLEQESIAREMEIPEDYCLSDEVAINARDSYYASRKETINKVTDDTFGFLTGNIKWDNLTKDKQHWRVDPSVLEKSVVREDSEIKQLKAYSETTLGNLTDERTRAPSRNLGYETDMIARKTRVSLLKLILDRQTNRKLVTSGGIHSTESLHDLAIQRTYGDEQWRNIFSGFSAPTPILKERCMELSFNNHLKLNILKQEEDMLIANVVEILELLEDPAYVGNIYHLFEESNK